MTYLRKQIKAKIDEQWEEQIKFLQTIGRFKSTLGNEGSLQNYLADYFQNEMQLSTEKIIPDIKEMSKHQGFSPVEWGYAGRPVVVGTWSSAGEKKGKSLILQSHIDVVPEGPHEDWRYDPWGTTIEGDRMYGRGIQDMKSGMAAMVFAVRALQSLGIQPQANIYLESVLEEEITGNGALATLLAGYKADAALIPEPLGQQGLIGQVGVVWMRVRVKGAAAHVERASSAVSAIEKAYVLIQAIQEYRTYTNERPRHSYFKDHPHPLNVNVGKIDGGDWTSSVASDCTFEVRVGFYPGEDPQTIKDEVSQWLMNAAAKDEWLKEEPPEITYYGFHADGVALEKDLDVFKTLGKAHRHVTGEEMQYSTTTATTDVRFYSVYDDIPATCYGPDGENMHGPNEWVDLPSIKRVTETYANFILDWCKARKD
ncbi:ArgE/DapE family deacylase [Salicibibacter cibarius]|uniref:ArgE/DapE family deacylase n=1 Tax=Salicibibacter cibarius TaxID=2743000 RepID=A0A7T6Z2J1_9BACI|nr:ArgE/DapE family deacylase [Salicibibacter cibarius]QQK75766.1 ArgE/DapE family deacylase [Salicibibacter cibarius]